jgi:hypothetical protein
VRIMLAMLGPVHPDPLNLPPGFAVHEPQVSTLLARKYRLTHESIEHTTDFHTAYCNLNLAEKIELINALSADQEIDFDVDEPSISLFYNRLRQCAIASLKRPRACLKSRQRGERPEEFRWRSETGHAKFLLADRNRIWVKKIISHTKNGGVPFYAFGVAHFLPTVSGPGILTQLQRAGFDIKLVKSMRGVPRHIRDMAARSETAPDEDIVCKVPYIGVHLGRGIDVVYMPTFFRRSAIRASISGVSSEGLSRLMIATSTRFSFSSTTPSRNAIDTS